jgi:hypothetical protein
MAYWVPNIEPITKTYRNVELTISPPTVYSCSDPRENMIIRLKPNPTTKVKKPDEEGNSNVFNGWIKKATTEVNRGELSKLMHIKGYSKILAEKVFTDLDTRLRESSSQEMALLPQLKVLIKRGLEEYKWNVGSNARPIFESEEKVSFIVDPEAH